METTTNSRQMIRVKYSCASCGVHRTSVEVPARENEDVAQWVQSVMAVSIGVDHAARSPRCKSRTISEVMIPTTGADKIGGAGVQPVSVS